MDRQSNGPELIGLMKKVSQDIKRLYRDPDVVPELLSHAKATDWDERIKRLRNELDHPVFRATTTFDYDRAYSFLVSLDQAGHFAQDDIQPFWETQAGTGGLLHGASVQHWAWLSISTLAPYYTYYAEERVLDEANSRRVHERLMSPFGVLPGYEAEQQTMDRYFDRYQYTLLPEAVVRRRVLGVPLALSAADQVTVLKCLFYDYESRSGEPILPPLA